MNKKIKSGTDKLYILRRQARIKRKQAKRNKKHRAIIERATRRSERQRHSWVRVRRQFIKEYYKKRDYNGTPINLELPQELGLEYNLNQYLDFAENLIDGEPQAVRINLKDSQFIWPSAITLLCSMRQWFDFTRAPHTRQPLVSSSESDNPAVNSYLTHCGFYDYVMRRKSVVSVPFDDNKVVKIVRERSPKSIKKKIISTRCLIQKYSKFTEEELEDFSCNVLPEVFLNVAEHGVNFIDAGWYTLTQYRPTTGVISLCVADNGIGIKNSLLTGPQADALSKRLPLSQFNDGYAIEEALKENVSGSWRASNKTETRAIFLKGYARGQRRGLGLTRIRDCCDRLGITMTIVSGRGAIQLERGVVKVFNRRNRVFAGTLYHFLIPANKELF